MIATNARIALLIVLGVAVGSCGSIARDEPAQSPASSTPTAESAYPSAFTVSRLSWEEAETALGYPLLRNEAVPLTWPYLFVAPSLDVNAGRPRKATALYNWNVTGVKIVMAPEAYFGTDTLRLGEETEVGGRPGWLRQRGQVMVFKFPFTTSDDFGAVWCQVELDTEDPGVMAEFVAGLK